MPEFRLTLIRALIREANYSLLKKYFLRKASYIKWINTIRNNTTAAFSGKDFFLIKKFLKLLLCYSDTILVQNEYCMEDIINNFCVPRYKIEILKNPINLENINLLRRESIEHIFFNNRSKVVLSIGRLEQQKGYHFLLEAFRLIINKVDAKMLIIGKGSQKRDLNISMKR